MEDGILETTLSEVLQRLIGRKREGLSACFSFGIRAIRVSLIAGSMFPSWKKRCISRVIEYIQLYPRIFGKEMSGGRQVRVFSEN